MVTVGVKVVTRVLPELLSPRTVEVVDTVVVPAGSSAR